MKNIIKIAKKLNINKNNLILYGDYIAKIKNVELKPKGKLFLITSTTPTPYGEGKTTVSICLADAFSLLNKKICLTLREPSLGPVFGVKGGATGSGVSTIEPSQEINLHFTGDFHAITSANNLLCSLVDNHIYHGNKLNIDTNKIMISRCLDINDRALRNIILSANDEKNKRKESFIITAASEIMAIICMSENVENLKERLSNIIVAYNTKNKPVYAKDLKAENAMTLLLLNAIKPNLVQTQNGTPVLVHGGPFANIAHGCNSVIATKFAMTKADFTITEAGFGSDLGAEKFFDYKCRNANLNPNAVVVVTTLKAIKHHGKYCNENKTAEQIINCGFENLLKHIENIRNIFNKKVVVAINRFSDDKINELQMLKKLCENHNTKAFIVSPYDQGGKSCLDLAKELIKISKEKNTDLNFSYSLQSSIKQKIIQICKRVYGAAKVDFAKKATEKINQLNKIAKHYPIIIAKTPLSLSDNPALLNRPKNFTVTITDLQLRNGAKCIVALAGNILLMPGLTSIPRSENVEI